MNNNDLKIKEIFDSASQNHKKNNFEVAENLYKKVLKINPDHFGSIFCLGALSVQTKRFDLAKTFLQKAIKTRPVVISTSRDPMNCSSVS